MYMYAHFPLVRPARHTPSSYSKLKIIIWRWGQGSSWPDKSTAYHDTRHSQHSPVNGDFRKRRYVDLFSTLALSFPYTVQSHASHVQLDTRPSSFSVCNIEKLGGAWGRGYWSAIFTTNYSIVPLNSVMFRFYPLDRLSK